MEFVAKSKKVKVTISGSTYEMRCPTIGERDEFYEQLNSSDKKSMKLYAEWFEILGLPKEAFFKLDSDDFLDFIEFVMNPKKKELS